MAGIGVVTVKSEIPLYQRFQLPISLFVSDKTALPMLDFVARRLLGWDLLLSLPYHTALRFQ